MVHCMLMQSNADPDSGHPLFSSGAPFVAPDRSVSPRPSDSKVKGMKTGEACIDPSQGTRFLPVPLFLVDWLPSSNGSSLAALTGAMGGLHRFGGAGEEEAARVMVQQAQLLA